MKTVAELIEELQAIEDQSLEVITAGDDEGNSYNRIYWSPTVMLHRTDTTEWEFFTDEEEALGEGVSEDDFGYVVVI